MTAPTTEAIDISEKAVARLAIAMQLNGRDDVHDMLLALLHRVSVLDAVSDSLADDVARSPEPAVDRKIAARDLHYTLIEQYGLKDDPVSNHTIRQGLERLAGFSGEPGEQRGVTISGNDLKEALEFIAPDGTPKQLKCDVRIEWGQNGHSGPGYYCFDVEYPDEGSILLGPDDKPDEPSSADISNARVAETHKGLAGAFKARDRMKAELAAEKPPLTKATPEPLDDPADPKNLTVPYDDLQACANEALRLEAALGLVRKAFDSGRKHGVFCDLSLLRDAEAPVRAALQPETKGGV